MKTFTVVLLYPDYMTDDFGAEMYVAVEEGEDAYAAVKEVQRQAKRVNTSAIDAEDFRAVLVLAGDVEVVLSATNF